MKRKLLTIILIIVSSFTLIAAVNAAGTEESNAMPDLYEYQHDLIIEPGNALNIQCRPHHWPENLEDHVPGSVRLFDDPLDVFWGRGDIPQRRTVYYSIDGLILDLVPLNDFLEFHDKVLRPLFDGPIDVMPLKLFIQHFNISREELEVVIMQMYENSIGIAEFAAQISSDFEFQDNGFGTLQRIYNPNPYADLNHEVHELPNLDVIFTFDNEIINWYYRRF